MTAPTRPLYAKLARRLATAVAVLVLVAIAPLVMLGLTHESAALVSIMAGIAGAVAVGTGGLEVAILTVLVMALIAPVSIVAGATPIAGAALMALMCMMVGRLSRMGLHTSTLLVPVFIAWTIISPPPWGPDRILDRTDGDYLAWMLVFFLVGGFVPVLALVYPLRRLNLPTPKPHPRRESVPYTVTITVLASVSTLLVLQHPRYFAGAWLITTIIVLVQPGDTGTVRRTLQRVAGTLLGSLIVGVVVVGADSLAVVYVIGLVFAAAAIVARFGPHYWLYMALITPTAVCLNAYSAAQVSALGVQRAADTVVGAVLVLLAAGITIGYSHLEQSRGHPATTYEPVVLGEPPTAGS